MLYGLPYLGQPSGLPSEFLWNYVLNLSSVLSSLRHQRLLTQALPLEFPAYLYQPRDYPLVNLEQKEAGAILGGTIPGATHYWDSSVHRCTLKHTNTRVKWAPQEEHWTVSSKPGNTKVTLKRL
jgi:hypothetical protein